MSMERIDFDAFSVSHDGLSTWRQCLRLLRIQRDSDQVSDPGAPAGLGSSLVLHSGVDGDGGGIATGDPKGGRMSHTPGPWHADGSYEVRAEDGRTIGGTSIVWEMGSRNPDDISLIVAAPDLLAALKDIIELGTQDSTYQAAKAAMAKAEGR